MFNRSMHQLKIQLYDGRAATSAPMNSTSVVIHFVDIYSWFQLNGADRDGTLDQARSTELG